MHVYKPPPVGGLDRVPVFTAGTGTTRADLFELDGVTPMPGNVLVADTGGNLPSFQCATAPVFVGPSGSRTTWTPSESGAPSSAASVTDSWWFAYAANVDPTNVSAAISWQTPTVVGTDIEIDGVDATKVNILTTGDYVLSLDLGVAPSSTAQGNLQVNLSIPNDPWLNVGNGQFTLPISPATLAAEPVWTTQPIRLPAGRVIHYNWHALLSAGSVGNASTALTIKRTS